MSEITDPHRFPPTYVSGLVACGCRHGVVALSFATALAPPGEGNIESDYIITTRLRMDLRAAQHLYAELRGLLQANNMPVDAVVN